MTEPSKPEQEREAPDSFYMHLGAAAKSRTGHKVLVYVWPYLFAILTAVGGYVTRSLELEPRLVKIETNLGTIASDIQALRLGMAKFTAEEQHKTIRVGRQAAYATAGFEAYEPPKLKAQKQAWAEKYGAAYDRMVTREGASPEVAYTALFKQVDVP